jgi:hypothetical protein
LSSTHCIDAADTNGDLRIAAPGDSGNCNIAGNTYTDNGDGTITDDGSGLVWEKKSDDGSIHDQDSTYNWNDASAVHVAALNAMSFAGHNDWRLPTIAELQTLIRAGSFPTVAPQFETGCMPGCTVLSCSCTTSSNYWSSSPYPIGPQAAYTVDFSSGVASALFRGNGRYVRAVRGDP